MTVEMAPGGFGFPHFSSESVLLQAIAGLLNRLPEIHGVRITHGPQERGKDIVFGIRGAFGEETLCGCIVKNAPITGLVKSNVGARTIYYQAQQAIETPYVDENGSEHFVERVYVITPYDISTVAAESIRHALRRGPAGIQFLSGARLFDLFRKYFPDYLVDAYPGPHSTKKQPKPRSADKHKDFFVSYNQADQTWAEWVAWTLESAGFL